MDVASLIGMIGGIGVIAYALLTSSGDFFDIASIVITIFGSAFATMLSTKLNIFAKIGKYTRIAFKQISNDGEKIISTLVTFAEKARREGILALEDDMDEVEDEFLKKGIQLAIDGTDPEIIKSILYIEVNQLQERHAEGASVFATWAEFAPAFGMIGTLVGLIEMMNNMGGDVAIIGSGMAKALVTTLYGSIMANAFLLPLKKKLDSKDRDEATSKEIIIEGILSIQAGDNPRILEMKLMSFLDPKNRKSQMDED